MRNDNITMLQNTLDIFTQGYYIKSGKRINLKLLPEHPSLGFSTIIFGGNSKFISSQTSIFAGFFHIQKNLTKKFLALYIYSAIVL